MAQKRLSDFLLSVSKRTRNENEDETVEQLEEKQDEKDKQEVEKGKQVKTTGMLRKVRVEWKQLYPWLDYKDGKMFCLWCCEYGNLSNASSSFYYWRMYKFKDQYASIPQYLNHYFSLIVVNLII